MSRILLALGLLLTALPPPPLMDGGTARLLRRGDRVPEYYRDFTLQGTFPP